MKPIWSILTVVIILYLRGTGKLRAQAWGAPGYCLSATGNEWIRSVVLIQRRAMDIGWSMFLPKPITLTIIWIKLNIIDRSLQGIAPIWGLLTRCFPIIFVRASRTYSYTCIVIFLILKDAAEMVVKIDSLLGSLRWNHAYRVDAYTYQM